MRTTLVTSCFIVLFAACEDPDDPKAKECGEEVVTVFSITDCNELYGGDTILTDGINVTTYVWSNDLSGSYRTIALVTSYDALCTYELPLISGFYEMVTDDPTIRDTIRISEAGGIPGAFLTNDLGTILMNDVLYPWSSEGDGARELSYSYTVYFPTLGDWPADSTYFFGNLVQMRLGMNGERQK